MRLATHDEEAWFAQPEDVIALVEYVPPPSRIRMLYALGALVVVLVCVGAFAFAG